jgi:hypothetical protein
MICATESGRHNGHQCQGGARASFHTGSAGVTLSVGDRVRQKGSKDENGVGTVVEALDSDGWVAIKWDDGSRTK